MIPRHNRRTCELVQEHLLQWQRILSKNRLFHNHVKVSYCIFSECEKATVSGIKAIDARMDYQQIRYAE